MMFVYAHFSVNAITISMLVNVMHCAMLFYMHPLGGAPTLEVATVSQHMGLFSNGRNPSECLT